MIWIFCRVRSSRNFLMTDQAMEKMPGALMMKVLYICSAMATRTGMQGVAATDTRATGAKPATVSERVNNSTDT